MEEDTSKIRDTTGTVVIQGPSIVLLVWRSIMFNGSFLRVYRILRFVKAVVSLFIFPTGPIALDCEPRGRRYAKNTGHDRNRLYSRAIHSPASMEMHYVQWFLLKSV